MSYGGPAEAERLRELNEPPRLMCGCLLGAHADTFTARKRAHPGEEKWR